MEESRGRHEAGTKVVEQWLRESSIYESNTEDEMKKVGMFTFFKKIIILILLSIIRKSMIIIFVICLEYGYCFGKFGKFLS